MKTYEGNRGIPNSSSANGQVKRMRRNSFLMCGIFRRRKDEGRRFESEGGGIFLGESTIVFSLDPTRLAIAIGSPNHRS